VSSVSSAPRAVNKAPAAEDAAAKAERAPQGDQPDDDGSKGGGRARLKIVK
jgi:stringent starvation protein B